MRWQDFFPRTFVLASFFGLIFGGGPLHPGPSDGTFFQWAPGIPVRFTLDPGGLSDAVPASLARELMYDATKEWNDVQSSRFEFQDNGLFPVDINSFNFISIFGLDLPPDQQPVLPENPIVFDRDGAIIDDFLGFGSSNSVIGFAGARFFDENARRYLSGWAVLNGKFASDSGFRAAIVHELGHLLGLDHSQGMGELAEFQNFSKSKYLPLMYPFQYSGLQPKKPIHDDIAWLSWMYPSSTFASSTGTITGKVFRRSGAPLLGANVVAVKVDEEGNELLTDITAVVSDFLDERTGEFVLPGLKPGQYQIFIEPLDSQFLRTEGHGVGPHDLRPTNFPKDYYDGNESANEDPAQRLTLTVAAGEEVSGVNLIANEVFNRLDLLGDDDEMLFEFPEGFTFPFFGEVYSEVVVNSDGNLTFEEGDGKVGDARTELRFLSGPPRIAPAFGDMDPSVGGEIRAVEGDGWVKFVWDQVPEFNDGPVRPPNTFSVTLYENGDILFDYENTELTPDFSEQYPQGLQAIAGISPGGVQTAVTQDLSIGTRTFELNGVPIYQVFPGETFDLDGRRIYFQGTGTSYYIPFYSGGNLNGQLGDLQQFTGFAVTNYGSEETDLILEARNQAGQLLDFPTNPGLESVKDEAQIAKLGNQVFGVGFATEQDGWIRLRSSQPSIASFFMIGNGLSGPQTKLDGSIAVSQQSQRLYFTRLYSGDSVFPSDSGKRPAKTLISLANPNKESIGVTFKHYTPGGSVNRQVVRSIGGLGVITEPLNELFKTETSFENGFVVAEVDGPGAVGFEMIEVGDTLMGINAVSDTSFTDSYSAQLAHGQGVIFTSLKLVNTTGFARTVTLTAFIVEAGGTVATVEEVRQLGAWGSLQAPVQEIFDLDNGSGIVEGSLRVECPNGGVVGDVIFGDPNGVKYAAALALQAKPFRQAVFSQISNAGDAFTGLAFLNPNASAVEIDVEVFDRDGNPVGEAQLALGAWERISRLLAEDILVPESAGLAGGYVVISASQPIIAQELFGNLTLDYLAAVPPEVLQ